MGSCFCTRGSLKIFAGYFFAKVSFMIFLQGGYRFLLIVHLAAAIVLLGASTHNVLILIRRSDKTEKSARLDRKFAAISFYSFLVCFTIGMIIYPAFRYYVRALHFDVSLPWATGMFEIKEHLLSLAFVAGLGHYLLSGHIKPALDRGMSALYMMLAFVFWGIVVFSSVSGALLTMIRSI